MKSILYVGATLMIGASIYGFVDYKQTHNKKEFKEMYVEEKREVPIAEVENKTTEPLVKKEKVSNDKKIVTKKKLVNTDEVITAIKPLAADEMIAVKEIKEIEQPSIDIKVSNESNADKKVVKKKKKLNHKIFSRAPLRDEEEVSPVKPAKEAIKKVENKDR